MIMHHLSTKNARLILLIEHPISPSSFFVMQNIASIYCTNQHFREHFLHFQDEKVFRKNAYFSRARCITLLLQIKPPRKARRGHSRPVLIQKPLWRDDYVGPFVIHISPASIQLDTTVMTVFMNSRAAEKAN